MDIMNKIFVYGTLKAGGRLHSHGMSNSKYLGEYESDEWWVLADFGAYPGLIPGDRVVYGEVYEVTDETLKRLDLIEGVPNLFIRANIKVRPRGSDDDYMQVLTYRFNNVSALWDYDRTNEWVV
tara:strand:+ start:332 stop:703 length:372 start_codon:yes stop_codon:yes gene_type:complete